MWSSSIGIVYKQQLCWICGHFLSLHQPRCASADCIFMSPPLYTGVRDINVTVLCLSACPAVSTVFYQRFLPQQTQDVYSAGLMLAHRLQRWANISPVLGYVTCLAPHWMWASVTDGGPTLTQVWFKALCRYMFASPPLTRQCVGVTCISPMQGHCVYTMCTHSRQHQD